MPRTLLKLPQTPPATQYAQGLTAGIGDRQRNQQQALELYRLKTQERLRQEELAVQIAKWDDDKQQGLADSVWKLLSNPKLTPDARKAIIEKTPPALKKLFPVALPDVEMFKDTQTDYGKPPWTADPKFKDTPEVQAIQKKAQEELTAPSPREKFNLQEGRLDLQKEKTAQAELDRTAARIFDFRYPRKTRYSLYEGLSPQDREDIFGGVFPEKGTKSPDVLMRYIDKLATRIMAAQNEGDMWTEKTLQKLLKDNQKQLDDIMSAEAQETPVTDKDIPTKQKQAQASEIDKIWDNVYNSMTDPQAKAMLDQGLAKGKKKAEILREIGVLP